MRNSIAKVITMIWGALFYTTAFSGGLGLVSIDLDSAFMAEIKDKDYAKTSIDAQVIMTTKLPFFNSKQKIYRYKIGLEKNTKCGRDGDFSSWSDVSVRIKASLAAFLPGDKVVLCLDGLFVNPFLRILSLPVSDQVSWKMATPPKKPALQVAGSLEFGEIKIDEKSTQALSLKNTGDTALIITAVSLSGANAADFSVNMKNQITIAPDKTSSIDVAFSPKAAADRAALLKIVSNDPASPANVSLKGQGAQGKLSVGISELKFGSVLVGTKSAVQKVSLKNIGIVPLTIKTLTFTGGNATDFGANLAFPINLNAGASVDLPLWFNPSSDGAKSASALIATNGLPASAAISLLATGIQPHLSASPSPLEFGDVPLGGTSSSKLITLTNGGTAPLHLKGVEISGTGSGAFSHNLSSVVTIAPGAKSDIAVAFKSTSRVDYNASLRILSDAPESPLAIPMHGRGVQGELSFSSSSINFGQIAVGQISAPISISFKNIGNGTLKILSFSLSGSNEFSTSLAAPADIAAGATVNINGWFAPLSEGVKNATFTFVTDGSPSTKTLSLSGSAVQAHMKLDKNSLDFSNVLVSGAGVTKVITITNTGGATLTVSGLGVSTYQGIFSLNLSAPQNIAPGQSTSVVVSFKPQESIDYIAQLSIISNAPESPLTVTLHGRGIEPLVAVSPTSLGFGSVDIGRSAIAQPITISNTGSAAMTVYAISISDSQSFSSDFVGPVSVAPGSNIVTLVSFAPKAEGQLSADLLVNSNARNQVAQLKLSGTGHQVRILTDRSSFEFGLVTIPETSVQDVFVTSDSSADMTIDSVALGGDSLDFAYQLSGQTIKVGEAVNLKISFKPVSPGEKSATLTVKSGNIQTSIALTGEAVQLPIVAAFAPIGNKVTNIVMEGAQDPFKLSSHAPTITLKISESKNETAPIILDASATAATGSTPLHYDWSVSNDTGKIALNPTGRRLGVMLPVGSYTARLIVSDGSYTCSFQRDFRNQKNMRCG